MYMTTSKGYIVIAQNTGTVDYLQQAYALALNLKLTQSTVNNLTVCVDAETKKKITSKSQRDVWATTKVRTFRGETVSSNYYREYFVKNNLPNVYTAFFYFKKSELASELFAMTEVIFQHWQRFFYKYMPEGKPDWLSGDVAFALAMQLLGIEHECTRENIDAVPTFVHMKSHIQNVPTSLISHNWSKTIPTYYNNYRDFKIGNFQQLLPFHYVEKDWLTAKMIKQMEQDYGI